MRWIGARFSVQGESAMLSGHFSVLRLNFTSLRLHDLSTNPDYPELCHPNYGATATGHNSRKVPVMPCRIRLVAVSVG